MVTARSLRSVAAVAVAAAWLLLGPLSARGDDAPAAPGEDARAAVKAALEKEKFPWYEPRTETVKPVWPPRAWNLEWLFNRLPTMNARVPAIGDLIGIGLATIAGVVLIVVLIQLWRYYRPAGEAGRGMRTELGRSARIEGLPAGVRLESGDPWAEAVARRARGDYAGAIVYLFAHQLLTLDRLRQIRLVPGRTGRQYVRAIDDRRYTAWVEPSLRLFESVYYGHHVPSRESFEHVWSLAEAFERHVVAGARA